MLIPDALYANELQNWWQVKREADSMVWWKKHPHPSTLPKRCHDSLCWWLRAPFFSSKELQKLQIATVTLWPQGGTLWISFLCNWLPFPQTTCGSPSLPFMKSITYAVLIRVCKSNIKILPWGNPMVQLCHFIFPFATLTRQGRLKHWARNYLFKATIQHTQTPDKDCSLSFIITVAS